MTQFDVLYGVVATAKETVPGRATRLGAPTLLTVDDTLNSDCGRNQD